MGYENADTNAGALQIKARLSTANTLSHPHIRIFPTAKNAMGILRVILVICALLFYCPPGYINRYLISGPAVQTALPTQPHNLTVLLLTRTVFILLLCVLDYPINRVRHHPFKKRSPKEKVQA
jgi:hypothetical protein